MRRSIQAVSETGIADEKRANKPHPAGQALDASPLARNHSPRARIASKRAPIPQAKTINTSADPLPWSGSKPVMVSIHEGQRAVTIASTALTAPSDASGQKRCRRDWRIFHPPVDLAGVAKGYARMSTHISIGSFSTPTAGQLT